MKNKLFIAALCFPIYLNADRVVFNKTFGGGGNDFAYSIRQTKDGGYIVAGQTESFGNGSSSNPDIWIIKLDSMGTREWDQTFGESGKKDGALSVCQTTDEGYIVSGMTSSFGVEYPSMWITKLDADGNSLWTKTYQGSFVSLAYSIQETADKGYIVAGKGEENILKLDADGNKEWGKRFGWVFYSVTQTADGGYIAAGDSVYRPMDWTYIPAVSIIKMDGNGNKEWNNPLGNNFLGKANCIQQTTDRGYIVAGDSVGYKSEFEYSSYLMVIKLDESGKREWNYFGSEFSDAQYVRQTADDGYIVAGKKTDQGYGLDITLIKLDKSGNQEWIKEYGSMGGWEYPSSVEQTHDGGYVVAGQTDSYGQGLYDMWILKLDENGNGPGAAGIPDNDAGQIMGFSLSQNQPNPFNESTLFQFALPESCFVSLTIYSITGEKVETLVSKQYPAGKFQVEWTAKNLPGGIYFYRLQAGPFSESKMLVLENKVQ